MRLAWMAMCIAIGTAGAALAEEPAHQADATTHAADARAAGGNVAHHPPLPYSHPELPEPAAWPGVMLLVIAGMFFAAAVIGPVVRANMEEELPPTHSHDEDHGHGGAHDPHGHAAAAHGHDHH